MKTTKTPQQREAERLALLSRVYGQDEPKPAMGRPPLPPDQAQTARIRERVTEAQFVEYQARGGKAWLVRELGRKVRK